MGVLATTDTFLLVGYENKVKCFDIQTGELLNEYEHEKTDVKVDLIAISEDEKLAAASFSDKSILVWKIIDNSFKSDVLKITIAKRSTDAVFHYEDEVPYLYIADKSGDVYKYDITLDNTPSEINPILGHVSMLLNVKISLNGKYILTSDRDEKIRVSLLQKPFEIESFCLGHEEFVCGIQVLKDNTVVSSSGDGSIKVWDFLTGEVKQNIVFAEKNQQNVFASILQKSKCGQFIVAASELKESNIIKLYSTNANNLKLLETITLSNLDFVVYCELITLNQTQFLIILGGDANEKMKLKKFEISEDGCKEVVDKVTSAINKHMHKMKAAYREHDLLALYKATFKSSPENNTKAEKRFDLNTANTEHGDVKRLKT